MAAKSFSPPGASVVFFCRNHDYLRQSISMVFKARICLLISIIGVYTILRAGPLVNVKLGTKIVLLYFFLIMIVVLQKSGKTLDKLPNRVFSYFKMVTKAW